MSKNSQVKALSALGLVGQVGLTIALCIVAGVFAGVHLDRLAGGSGILLAVAILAGVFAGLYGAFRILTREMPWNR